MRNARHFNQPVIEYIFSFFHVLYRQAYNEIDTARHNYPGDWLHALEILELAGTKQLFLAREVRNFL